MPQGEKRGSDGTAVERHGGLGRSRMDRQFPPLGVKFVASNDRNLKVIFKLRRQALQIRPSQRAEPSPSWLRLCRKTVTGRGFSRVLTT